MVHHKITETTGIGKNADAAAKKTKGRLTFKIMAMTDDFAESYF